MISRIITDQEEYELLLEYIDWRNDNGFEPTSEQYTQFEHWSALVEAACGGSFLPWHVLALAP